jgi:nucleoside-diphosphate-sugar epimerase
MEVIEGATYVCDLSMGGGLTWEDYERDYIGGARNVGKACLRHGVKRLLYTSSISALFLGSGKPIKESDGADPLPLKRGFYGRAKIGAEQELMKLHASDKLPVVVFRPGVVIGPGGMLVHGALGDTTSGIAIIGYGSGKHPLPWVLAEDVAQAMFISRNIPGIDGEAFNLAGDFRPTAAEFVEELRLRSKRNFRFYSRSIGMIRLAEFSRWALKAIMRKPGNVLIGARDTQGLQFSSYLDCSRAKQVLGWKPVADREEFYRQAIDIHLPAILPGDLRLS